MSSMLRQYHVKLQDLSPYLRGYDPSKPASAEDWSRQESACFEPGMLIFCLERVSAPSGLAFGKREDAAETYKVRDLCVVVGRDNGRPLVVDITASAFELRFLEVLLLEKARKAILDGKEFLYAAAKPSQPLNEAKIREVEQLGAFYAQGGTRRTLVMDTAGPPEPALALLGVLGAKVAPTGIAKQPLDIGSVCHMLFTPDGRQEDRNKSLVKQCFTPLSSTEPISINKTAAPPLEGQAPVWQEPVPAMVSQALSQNSDLYNTPPSPEDWGEPIPPTVKRKQDAGDLRLSFERTEISTDQSSWHQSGEHGGFAFPSQTGEDGAPEPPQVSPASQVSPVSQAPAASQVPPPKQGPAKLPGLPGQLSGIPGLTPQVQGQVPPDQSPGSAGDQLGQLAAGVGDGGTQWVHGQPPPGTPAQPTSDDRWGPAALINPGQEPQEPPSFSVGSPGATLPAANRFSNEPAGQQPEWRGTDQSNQSLGGTPTFPPPNQLESQRLDIRQLSDAIAKRQAEQQQQQQQQEHSSPFAGLGGELSQPPPNLLDSMFQNEGRSAEPEHKKPDAWQPATDDLADKWRQPPPVEDMGNFSFQRSATAQSGQPPEKPTIGQPGVFDWAPPPTAGLSDATPPDSEFNIGPSRFSSPTSEAVGESDDTPWFGDLSEAAMRGKLSAPKAADPNDPGWPGFGSGPLDSSPATPTAALGESAPTEAANRFTAFEQKLKAAAESPLGNVAGAQPLGGATEQTPFQWRSDEPPEPPEPKPPAQLPLSEAAKGPPPFQWSTKEPPEPAKPSAQLPLSEAAAEGPPPFQWSTKEPPESAKPPAQLPLGEAAEGPPPFQWSTKEPPESAEPPAQLPLGEVAEGPPPFQWSTNEAPEPVKPSTQSMSFGDNAEQPPTFRWSASETPEPAKPAVPPMSFGEHVEQPQSFQWSPNPNATPEPPKPSVQPMSSFGEAAESPPLKWSSNEMPEPSERARISPAPLDVSKEQPAQGASDVDSGMSKPAQTPSIPELPASKPSPFSRLATKASSAAAAEAAPAPFPSFGNVSPGSEAVEAAQDSSADALAIGSPIEPNSDLGGFESRLGEPKPFALFPEPATAGGDSELAPEAAVSRASTPDETPMDSGIPGSGKDSLLSAQEAVASDDLATVPTGAEAAAPLHRTTGGGTEQSSFFSTLASLKSPAQPSDTQPEALGFPGIASGTATGGEEPSMRLQEEEASPASPPGSSTSIAAKEPAGGGAPFDIGAGTPPPFKLPELSTLQERQTFATPAEPARSASADEHEPERMTDTGEPTALSMPSDESSLDAASALGGSLVGGSPVDGLAGVKLEPSWTLDNTEPSNDLWTAADAQLGRHVPEPAVSAEATSGIDESSRSDSARALEGATVSAPIEPAAAADKFDTTGGVSCVPVEVPASEGLSTPVGPSSLVDDQSKQAEPAASTSVENGPDKSSGLPAAVPVEDDEEINWGTLFSSGDHETIEPSEEAEAKPDSASPAEPDAQQLAKELLNHPEPPKPIKISSSAKAGSLLDRLNQQVKQPDAAEEAAIGEQEVAASSAAPSSSPFSGLVSVSNSFAPPAEATPPPQQDSSYRHLADALSGLTEGGIELPADRGDKVPRQPSPISNIAVSSLKIHGEAPGTPRELPPPSVPEPAPQVVPLAPQEADFQEPKLVMNEMATLESKLEQQVAKAGKKLGTRAEDAKQRLNSELERLLQEASEVEKQSQISLAALMSRLTKRLDDVSEEVRLKIADLSSGGRYTIKQLLNVNQMQVEETKTSLYDSLRDVCKEFRVETEVLISSTEERLNKLVSERSEALQTLIDNYSAQIEDTNGAYIEKLITRFQRFRERMAEEAGSVIRSLERNVRSMSEEIDGSWDRASDKLKSSKGEFEQTIGHTVATSGLSVSYRSRQILTEQLLPRLREKKVNLVNLTNELSRRFTEESDAQANGQLMGLETSLATARQQLQALVEECMASIDTVGRGQQAGLEEIFKETSAHTDKATAEVIAKLHKVEAEIKESELACKRLAETSSLDTDPEVMDERNLSTTKVQQLRSQATAELNTAIDNGANHLEQLSQKLQSDLSSRRLEQTQAIRDAAENGLSSMRDAIQEAFAAIQSARERYYTE